MLSRRAVLPDVIARRPHTFAEARPPLIQVTDTVFIAQGSYGGSSSVLVLAGDERVVVNTSHPNDSAGIRADYDRVSSGPISHCVFTQGHPDHYGGHRHLSDPDTAFVVHHRYRDVAVEWEMLLGTKGRRLPVWFEPHGFMSYNVVPTDPTAITPPEPQIEVDESVSLHVGGRQIEVLATPGAEATDALSVWLPDERVAIVGNMFGALLGHIPNFQTMRGDRIRDPLVIIESFNRILDLEPAILVVGHHDAVYGHPDVCTVIERVRDATQWLHDRTIEGLEAGQDVAALMTEIELPDELEVMQGYGDVAWGVRAIATHYLGWFQAHSTLELYPTRPSDAAAEIVELCGTEALVRRGKDLLDIGKPLRALQLAEIVLGADSSEENALDLFAACHDRLYETRPRDNVWRDGWLRWNAAEARATGRRPNLWPSTESR